ncbi:unnamed protein product, partial [Cyprideis torosa]
MPLEQMKSWFSEKGEPAFRAVQVYKWVHQAGVDDFSAMTNLSKKLRERLIIEAEIKAPDVVMDQPSSDGTRKWLFRLHDGQCIEVNERPVTNVVMMGMGEPLLNYDNVVNAMGMMLDDLAYGLSRRRVTVSTSGVVPALNRLGDDIEVALAVSLHAPNDELRDQLVPLNKKYPIDVLLAACHKYLDSRGNREKVTFEYVLLAGVNDQPEHASQLAKLMKTIPSK